MSTTVGRMTHFGQRFLLIAAGIGVWLPASVVVIFYLTLSTEKSLGSGMAFGAVCLIAAQLELAAIVLLLIYAGWARPWKIKTPAYDTFIMHSCAAGLIVLSSVMFLLSRVN